MRSKVLVLFGLLIVLGNMPVTAAVRQTENRSGGTKAVSQRMRDREGGRDSASPIIRIIKRVLGIRSNGDALIPPLPPPTTTQP
jgi:hypothetical protein